ncbi:hypothetical protein HPP92_023873 [Vanilla planifolia]|uniref:Uncharacterized protein n=1 Tax=Vanilla planifolia TaxID=51239 RepID=A0A835PIN7_VANPL|nr:hypothetical protein HPP92_023873 [Vanilla planifolia]
MDKGNGKEQRGDTQQELAQTLVSLSRSIGGTNNQVTEASIDWWWIAQRMHPPLFCRRGRSNDSLRTGMSCPKDKKVALAVLIFERCLLNFGGVRAT